MRLIQRLSGTILVFLFFALTAQAQTTYIGPNNGDYNTAANWTNGVPAAGNNGLIPGGGVNVVISSATTINYTLDVFSSLTATAPVTIATTGNLAAAGTLNINTGGSLTNNGTYNNFGTTTFSNTSTFTNGANATFVNGGTFTLPGTLNNSGSVTNNGTLNAANGLVQTQGSFSNNQTMTVRSLTISAGSQFINNFGAQLTVNGTGATFDAAGNVTNNGTVTLAAASTITGIFDNNVTLQVEPGFTLNVPTAGRINNGGTVLIRGTFTNSGTVFNNNNFYNEGTATNFGTFAQNNRLENRLGATWNNEGGSAMNMGFGAVILNTGNFNQRSEMISTGAITNDGTYTVTGSIINNSGGVIDNNKTFNNNGTITSFNAIINDDVFNNNGRIVIGSGCVLTNNKNFNNNTSGTIRNEFELVNTTGATFTNRGRLENIIRIFVNGGTFSNQAFIENSGDIFTKAGATLSNSGYLLQSAGNIKNEGSTTNSGTLYSDDCSTINNTGTVNNTGSITLRGVFFQRGTLSGSAVTNDGGYIHTAATSAAPAVCATRTITADVDGVVKAYATGLITFATFDSCQNMIYTANGIARPTFSCSDIGTPKGVNLKIVTRLQDSLTCVATVNPVDALAPDFTNCPSDITVTTPNNSVNVSWTAPTVTDNCTATPNLVVNRTPGSSFNVGVTAVTYTATDGAGNTQQCQFKVNVIRGASASNCTGDVTGPVFTGCPGNQNIATDRPATPVVWIAPTVSDPCQPLSVTSNFAPGTTFGQGKTTVRYTARDGNGNTSTCQFVVTLFQNDRCLNDTEKPVFNTCPANIYLPTNTALNGALAIWTAPQVADNCAVTEQLASHQSGTVFPVGSTTVTFTAKDAANNTATCRFTVTVGADPCPGDVTGPTITGCPASQTVNIALGSSGTATWTPPTANDACGPVSLNSDFTPGAAFPVGVTKVTYTASDRKGNKSTCTFNITVNTPCSADVTPPTISGCPANITVGTTATSAAATWSVPFATDICGVAGFTSSYSPGAVFPVGTTQVVYTASDFRGNTSSCIFNVQVVNAPACTTNSSPINNATAIAPASVTLSWNTAAGADRYDVYLGLTSTTMKLIAPDVAATSVTVTNLNGGTDYFWYVLPKNSAGAPASCTSFTKFTTSGTPQGGGSGGNPTQIDNNLPICVGTLGQGWTVQTWNNIPGTVITDLTNHSSYPNNPSSTVLVTNSKSTWNVGDNYGTRVRGFITPATSGSYVFTITGDDQTEFYLSPNADPTAKVRRAFVQDYSGETEYTKYAAMTSAPINLTAGQAYYVEILQKEGGGGDGWNLTWTGPGITTRTNIPLSRMSPIVNCTFTGGTPATSSVSTGATSRTSNGLIALYDFKEGSGATVRDVSGFGTPLDLTIANTANVTRISGGCGLNIHTATIIKPGTGVSSSKLSNALNNSHAITIEAWVKPLNFNAFGPARIATYSADTGNRNFTLGQEGNNYAARLRTTETNTNGEPTNFAGGYATTGLQHVVFIRNASGYEAMYVDNELAYEAHRGGTFNFNSAYSFALGNELTNDRPWLGEMYLVAIYERALTVSEIGQNYHAGVCSFTNLNVCTANVIANGGFEKDFYGHWVSNGPTIITNPVASGSKAAQACNSDSGFGEVLRATPGASYTMTASARVSNSPSWAAVGLKFTDINGTQIGAAIEKQVTNSTAYNTFTNTGVAPANAHWVEYYAWKSGAAGCLQVDNVCVRENTLCNTTLTVVNNGNCTVKLYYVSNGVEVFYADIAAGATRKQPTFDTHTWRVRRSADAALVRELAMSGCVDQTITISSCGTPGTPSTGTGCPTDTQPPTFTGCPSNITVNATGSSTTATATWTAPTASDNCGTPLRASNYAPGATFSLGTTTVRYTAFDTRGNTATCQFTVTVANPCANDTQAPTFAGCPGTQTKTTSDLTTTVSWTPPTASDNCGTPTLVSTATPGQFFAPGTTVVRYTAVDSKGNTATCQFNVVVTSTNQCANDTQPPVITLCPSNQTVTTTGTSAQVNWQSPQVNDNCGIKSFVANYIPGLFFPLGNTTVSYVATDVFDNRSTCSFVVTVTQQADPCANETTPPVLSGCPSNRTVTAAPGATTATTTWTAPTATDNCPGVVTITSSHNSGAAFPIGNTTVTYTARDARNNSATCTFVVTVNAAADPCANETTPPVLSGCPSNRTVTAALGATTATTTWTAPTATDNCPGVVTITSSHNSGAAFPIGSTTVTYTARDARNNSATCTFTVTVNPNPNDCANINIVGGAGNITVSGLTAPIVMIQVFNAQWSGVFNCAGNCNQPVQAVNGLAAGQYFVKVDFLDASWGALCRKEQFVTVTSGTGGGGVLTFNTPANITVNAPAGANQATVTYPTPTATTTCTTGTLTVNRSSGIASGGIFPVGTSQVCFLATDGCGNTKEVCFNVVVNATSTGSGSCNDITITPGPGNITVSGLVSPITYLQVYDGSFTQVFNCAGNCASPTQVVSNLTPGTYFVKASLADASWTPTCSKEVFVNVTGGGSQTVLTFNPPANITVNAAPGATTAIVNYTAPTGTTTCTTGTITYNRTQGLASGSAFPVGTTQVCYTATDGCGNVKTACFNVVVNATTGSGPDCNTITFTPGAGSLTIGNLVAPVVMIQVFNAQWTGVFNCAGNCTTPTQVVSGLTPGTYYVKVDFLTSGWAPICQRNETITITSALAIRSDVSFSVQKVGKATDLRWISSLGAAGAWFDVERSADGLDFEAIITDIDARAAANEVKLYTQRDEQPLEGDNYYRLRVVQLDGTVRYSATQKVHFADFDAVSLFPNPASDVLYLNLLSTYGREVSLTLYNAQGQLAAQRNTVGTNDLFIWDVADLQSGMYMLRIDAEGQRTQMLKVVIQR